MKDFKTIEEATEAFAKVSAELEQAKADLKEKDELIKDIRAAKNKSVDPEFTYNKKTYVVKAKQFHFNKEDYTAEDVLSNKDLQKILIEGKVGFVEEKE